MGAQLSGGGGSKYSIQQNSEINVTPFVDVMLVLLIIFMVAAPLATVSVKVDLPNAVAKPSPNPPKPVFISIKKSGSLYNRRLSDLSGWSRRRPEKADRQAGSNPRTDLHPRG